MTSVETKSIAPTEKKERQPITTGTLDFLEASTRFELVIMVLQTTALPLGDEAERADLACAFKYQIGSGVSRKITQLDQF